MALQRSRLIALQFRQNFKPRVNFAHYPPSQRTFYAIETFILTPSIVHYPPSQRSFYAISTDFIHTPFAITTDYNLHQSPITTSSIRHHCPISTLIHRNPTDHFDIPIRSYPSQSLPSIIRISNAISTDNTP